MSEENKKYVPYTTEQKKEYAKQFTPNEIKSYRKGQRSAYAHMGNIGRRNSFYLYDNLKKDETATPPPAPPKPAAKKKPKKQQSPNTRRRTARCRPLSFRGSLWKKSII